MSGADVTGFAIPGTNKLLLSFTEKGNGSVTVSGTAGATYNLDSFGTGGGTPGGTSGQLQCNSAGTFGGIPWTYNATHNQLNLTGVSDAGGIPAILIDRSSSNHTVQGKGSGIVFRGGSDTNGSNAALVVSTVGTPGGVGVDDVRGMIDQQGAFYSNANFFMSGSFRGYTDPATGAVTITSWGLSPLPADLQPTAFVGIIADQNDALCIAPANYGDSTPVRLITGVDRNKNYIWSVDGTTARMNWGVGATRASMDVGLGRIAAGTLAIGNGTEGGYSGALKLATLNFADGTSQATAGATVGGNNTWTGNQTFSGTNNTLSPSCAIQDSGGSALISVDASNNVGFGGTGYLTVNVKYGKNFVIAPNPGAMFAVDGSTRTSQFGGNNNLGNSTVYIYDETAATGDTVLALRDGAARAARIKFGATSSFDVGISRSTAGQLSITDGSTTLTNYRDLLMRDIFTSDIAFMHRTKATLNDGAASSAGTLTNAPAVGNPTKWIPIDDNGTTRYIPAW